MLKMAKIVFIVFLQSLSLVCYVLGTASPSPSPAPPPIRPRYDPTQLSKSGRFPVHLRNSKLAGISSSLPPITDVTPTLSTGVDKIKVLEIGTPDPTFPTITPKVRRLKPIIPGERSSLSIPQPTRSFLSSPPPPPPAIRTTVVTVPVLRPKPTQSLLDEFVPGSPDPPPVVQVNFDSGDYDDSAENDVPDSYDVTNDLNSVPSPTPISGYVSTSSGKPYSPFPADNDNEHEFDQVPELIQTPTPTTFRPILPPVVVTVPVPTRPPIIPPSTEEATPIPILGFGSRSSSAPASGRSLFGSRVGGSPGAVRRPVGGRGDPGTLKQTSRENFKEVKVEQRADPASVITDYVFSDIKCYRTKQKEYFGAKIHLKRGFNLPYIRDRPQDPLTSDECHLERTDEPNTFHMKMNDLRGCGVEQCGDSMCITMVFPRVPTLALADDEVTTIKCLPQKSSMSEMRTISFAGDSFIATDFQNLESETSKSLLQHRIGHDTLNFKLENRRSGSTVEGGGQEFAAEVGVFRQNPGTSNGLFVKRVNSGGVVQLGERLQLRSVVRGGDGWTFSKLSDVKVWRMRDSYAHGLDKLNPNDASEVITLVDGKGCRNIEYKVIADAHPLRDPRNDLVHHFTFKAFLFRGQRANEPLIVTAKVQACQERDDCDITDCKTGQPMEFTNRYKRSIKNESEPTASSTQINPSAIVSPTPTNGNISSIIHDWDSHFALRVVGMKDHSSALSEADFDPSSTSSYHNARENEISYNNNYYHGNGRSLSSYTCAQKMGFSGFIGSFVTLLLSSLVFTLISFCMRSKRIENNFQRTQSLIERTLSNSGGQGKDPNNPHSILKKSMSHSDLSRTPPTAAAGTMNELNRIARRRSFSGANKPLPPTPKESNDRNLSRSDVSQLLYNLQSSGGGSEKLDKDSSQSQLYEVVPEKNCSKDSKDKEYVVVYVDYKGKQHKRSRSAPASVRIKQKHKDRIQLEDLDLDSLDLDLEEDPDQLSEESDDLDENQNSRRTVRSVKRSNKQQRNRELRRKLTAIYKDGQAGKIGSGGSFPVRGIKKPHQITSGSRSVRQRGVKVVNFAEDYSDSSLSAEGSLGEDLDSAYSGSISSKDVGAASSAPISKNPVPKTRPNNNKNFMESIRNLSQPKFDSNNNSNISKTHFITSNESGTIICIPETNV